MTVPLPGSPPVPPPPPLPPPPVPALVIGEALTDVLTGPGGERSEHPGGSPANVALGLGRLGHPVRLATRIGRDRTGRVLREWFDDGGIELLPGSVGDAPTSTATARLGADGTVGYDFDLVWDLAPATIAALHSGPPVHLHIGSIAAALPPGADQVLAAAEQSAAGATVSYDPNIRPALLGAPERERARVEHLVEVSDLVKASDEDLHWLYPGEDPDTTAARWARRGPALVVVTRGSRGARAWWRHGHLDVPAAPIRVVDTVGAGDSFMSALVSGLLRRELLSGGDPSATAATRARLRAATDGRASHPDVAWALRYAVRAAGITCSRAGAAPPTYEELARPRD
ncbi:fructokinase [Actinacidiphila yanglinensis]|uniref:Fructokinase n=1 Tax=Actinacidiphila yanglinensis TaxID=310779 RepID=A0A1H6DAC5_9ACTN|nr:carbohydrate kinase [Actinacidiphila yanglinensis]SEG82132.1 fructokinase [Actinacidiphila yanglinensis]